MYIIIGFVAKCGIYDRITENISLNIISRMTRIIRGPSNIDKSLVYGDAYILLSWNALMKKPAIWNESEPRNIQKKVKIMFG